MMKRLGFGCMRLPMIGGKDGEVDLEQFQNMVDRYMEAGFCYFDTARIYLSGQSERAIRTALVERYPRESFFLVYKLTGPLYDREEDIRPFFQSQLEDCGVTYFDGYLMHSMNRKWFDKALRCNAFSVVKQLKEEGKIRHIGISFHDTPEMLEEILTAWPEVEMVQIQMNYLDWDNPNVQSRGCYEVCRKFGKPVLVMEPVKGGTLAVLPPEGSALLKQFGDASDASYAIRFAASLEGVAMVLSGMSDRAQMEDNLRTMDAFVPLNETELAALEQVKDIIRTAERIPCTDCRYCVDGCPMQIPIPDLFKAKNEGRWVDEDLADTCVACGQCEGVCPQHLPVIQLLKRLAG